MGTLIPILATPNCSLQTGLTVISLCLKYILRDIEFKIRKNHSLQFNINEIEIRL